MTSNEPNNMPLHAPMYPSPWVPYHCPQSRSLDVVCEGKEEEIRRIVSYTPFESVSNKFVVQITDCNNLVMDNGTPFPFMDAEILFPVRFRDVTGGYLAYEWEDQDESVACGREIFGYPKKFGTAKIEEKGNRILAVVERKNVKLIEAELTLTGGDVPKVQIDPRLVLQVLPNTEKPGILLKRVLLRDTSQDFVMKSRKTGEAKVSFGKLDSDPIFKLGPTKVLGGVFTVGDIFGKDIPGHGWCKILATL